MGLVGMDAYDAPHNGDACLDSDVDVLGLGMVAVEGSAFGEWVASYAGDEEAVDAGEMD